MPSYQSMRSFSISYGMGLASSLAATQMLITTIMWQYFSAAQGRYAALMFVGAQLIPQGLAMLPAGYVVDRYDRKTLWLVSIAILGGLSIALAFFSPLDPGLILATLTLHTVCRSVEFPSSVSLLSASIEAKSLPASISLAFTIAKIAQAAAPLAAGLLLSLNCEAVTFGVIGSLYACAFMFVLSCRRASNLPTSVKDTSVRALDGVRIVLNDSTIRSIVMLDLAIVSLCSVNIVMPMMLIDKLRLDGLWLGLFRSLPLLGALCASVVAGFLKSNFTIRWFYGTVLLYAVATLVFGISPSILHCSLALVGIGFFDSLSVIARQVIIQNRVSAQSSGKVNSATSFILSLSNQIGDARASLCTAIVDPSLTVVSGAVLSIGVIVSLMIKARASKRATNVEAM